jgi:hypothetical protein
MEKLRNLGVKILKIPYTENDLKDVLFYKTWIIVITIILIS